MTRFTLLCTVVVAAVATSSVYSRPKTRPTPCPGGRFLLDDGQPPLLAAAASAPDAITISSDAVTIASGCDAAPATIRATRKSTRVRARWSTCGAARRVRLRATIAAPGCTTLAGVLKTRGAKPTSFTATIEGGSGPTTTTTLPPGSVTGLDAVYALRDDVLSSSPRGQHYTALFETHRTEVVAWLMHEDGLLAMGKPAFLSWLPLFEALVNGRGDTALVTTAHIADLEEFFARLSVPASPALQSTIETELAAMAPLSRFAGMSMTQALAAVFAVPVPVATLAPPAHRNRGAGGCAVRCFMEPECTY